MPVVDFLRFPIKQSQHILVSFPETNCLKTNNHWWTHIAFLWAQWLAHIMKHFVAPFFSFTIKSQINFWEVIAKRRLPSERSHWSECREKLIKLCGLVWICKVSLEKKHLQLPAPFYNMKETLKQMSSWN